MMRLRCPDGSEAGEDRHYPFCEGVADTYLTDSLFRQGCELDYWTRASVINIAERCIPFISYV